MSSLLNVSGELSGFLQTFNNNEGDQNTTDVKKIWAFADLHGLDYETAEQNLFYAEELNKIAKNILTTCVQSTPFIESLNLRQPELIPELVKEIIFQERTSPPKYAEVGCQARATVNQGTSMTPTPESEANGDVTFNMSQFYALFDAMSFAEHFKNMTTTPPPEVYRTTYCPFCHKNGEHESNYKSHNLTDPITGAVVCPVLKEYVCPLCGASGATAHTASYCPLKLTNRKTRGNYGRKANTRDFHIGHWN